MFIGFNTAVRGLLASQRGLYTTGHNIDNTATPGYSRQLIDQEATRAMRVPGIGYQGTGSQITQINRVRDSFIDYKYWKEMSPLGEWRVKNQGLSELEHLINEPSDTSFRQYLDDFYRSIEDLATNPSDPSYRDPVIENGLSFTKHINDVSKRMENMEKDLYNSLDSTVDKINQLGDQIKALNKQIYMQEVDGASANDLRDRRELLVDELAELVDVSVTESDDGKYDVSIGGNSLVHHFHSSKISINPDSDERSVEKAIVWQNSSPVKFNSGELKGQVDLLYGNGKNNQYKGIVYYRDQLDNFAKGFASKFNEQHKKGKDLDGNPGLDFFTFVEGAEEAASTISINPEILKNRDKLAAGGETGNGAAEDGRNLLELLSQRDSLEFFNDEDYPKGSPDDYIKSVISTLAVDSLQTVRFLDTKNLMKKNLENKRQSISGVNLNEEMSNIVRYQKVYVASSKMISTLDMLLDVTINRLGTVGR